MVAPAIFGITNDGLNLAVKLLLLFLVAIWFALIWWTYADARRRVGDPMLVTCATFAAAFFPFVGSIVYAIVRPPEYLEDARERELEIAAAEAKLLQVQESTCPSCGHDIEKTFLRCPHCATRLKEPCVNCARPLDPRWQMCPYCEAEVAPAGGAAAAGQGRGRRRRTPAAGGAERSAPARQTAAAREPAPVRERPRREPDPRTESTREPRAGAQPTRETRVPSPDERPARVLPDAGARPPAPDPSARVTDATAEQPARRPRPSTGPA